jgi:nucleoside-diphosphate-sugar epimerase
MKKEQITLIGRGWLGSSLAQALEDLGHTLLSTTRTPKEAGLLFDITKEPPPELLRHCDILIYTIPPLPLEFLAPFFAHFPKDQKIIFISSTSVYGKNQGLVDEISSRSPESANGKMLMATEDFLLQHFKAASILRPGGLYGDGRHPIYFLQNRSGLKNGGEFTHLAHRNDCIKAILKIIETHSWGEIFNLVSDLKMKKSLFYPTIAEKLKLPPPLYVHTNLPHPTIIDNQKSKGILGLLYHDPLESI